jgi:excisionase family DNA binding protein
MNKSQNKNREQTKLLLQSEAAALLRCSIVTISRLRLSRKLGYYTGRPVLISEADLELYVASAKVLRVKMPGPPGEYGYVPAETKPHPFKLLTIAEAAQRVRRTPQTIRRWITDGKLPYIRSRSKCIDEADLDDFVLCVSHRPGTEPPPNMSEFKRKEWARTLDEIHERLRVVSLKKRMPGIVKSAKRLQPPS